MAAERDGVLSIHQLRACGVDDDAVAVADYLWRHQRVAIEADSITWQQITGSPQQTLARIRAALG